MNAETQSTKTLKLNIQINQRVVFRDDEWIEAVKHAAAWRDGVAIVYDENGRINEEATVARWMRARTRTFFKEVADATDGEGAEVRVTITDNRNATL